MADTRIDYMPLSALLPADRNPKTHADAEIQRSIDRFGFVNPVTINEGTGQLVAGHGRVSALKALKQAGASPPSQIRVASGDWLVPVVRGITFKDQHEVDAYIVADNRLVELGGWDEKALASVLEELRAADVSLAGIGWDGAELDRMVAAADHEVVSGPTVDERAVSFTEGSIKQIQLFFTGAEFDNIVARLQVVMDANQLDSNTAVFKFLLERYEDSVGNPSVS